MLYVCCDLLCKGTTKNAMRGFLKSQICFAEKPLTQIQHKLSAEKSRNVCVEKQSLTEYSYL